jgi:hypothetical protein
MTYHSLRSNIDRIKRYFWFSHDELKNFVIICLVFAFMMSFNEWGIDHFDLLYGIKNFIIALVIVTISVFVCEAGHRLAALVIGFKVESKMWWPGLIIALIILLISGGKIYWVYAGFGIFIHHMAAHRLGKFRYGLNVKALGWIAIAGPIACVLFGGLIKNIQLYLTWIPINAGIADKIFSFNMIFAAISLLPIPPLAGSRLLFFSRLWYAFIAGTIFSYAILIRVFDKYSYIWALVIGIATWLIFYIFFEKGWWSGG